jgi:hypothetical protein
MHCDKTTEAYFYQPKVVSLRPEQVKHVTIKLDFKIEVGRG